MRDKSLPTCQKGNPDRGQRRPCRLWFAAMRLCQTRACRLPAILLWMHNGLSYIYAMSRVERGRPGGCTAGGLASKERNMSIEQFIDNEVKSNDVVLFMKGTPQFPQCGFSGQVVQILDHVGVGYKGLNVLESARPAQRDQNLFELADHSATLRQGRVRRRLRYHPRDVSGGRVAATVGRQGCARQRASLGLSLAARQLGPARLEVVVAELRHCALMPSSTRLMKRCRAAAGWTARFIARRGLSY